jgi:hypothetical protein
MYRIDVDILIILSAIRIVVMLLIQVIQESINKNSVFCIFSYCPRGNLNFGVLELKMCKFLVTGSSLIELNLPHWKLELAIPILFTGLKQTSWILINPGNGKQQKRK